jgi:hypothetical protein
MDSALIFGDFSLRQVGIGTKSPSATLHVAGSSIIDGTATISNVGSGAASDSIVTINASGLIRKRTVNSVLGSAGFFKKSTADTSHIIYSDATNYGKNFLVNTDSVNYDGSGTDAKMMFIASKSAFRAGAVNDNSWNKDSIGFNSFATGYNSKATGNYSIAMGALSQATANSSVAIGNQTIASGWYSTATGLQNTASGVASTALGIYTTATGSSSTAMGSTTTATGEASTAMGHTTIASGLRSTAMGNITRASGSYSTAMGNTTTASGESSTAMGVSTQASGNYSLATGYSSQATGNVSTALGGVTLASGNSSTAMGESTRATGNQSTAMGMESYANGHYSTAMGRYAIANGIGSTAMGYQTSSSADYSTAMGYTTTASGQYSTAMGAHNTASGQFSTAMGRGNVASGQFSTAMGESTKAQSYGELAVGTFNDNLTVVNATTFAGDTNRVFTVGNGVLGSPKTAFVVQQNGQVGVNSGKPSSTLQVAGNIADSIRAITSTAYTLRNTESTILVNSTAATTVTLPDPASCYGRRITIKKINTSSYSVTHLCTGGSSTKTVEGVDGSTGYNTVSSGARYGNVFQSDGTAWWIVSNFTP